MYYFSFLTFMGTDNTSVILVVTCDVPKNLYYYCPNHKGMGNMMVLSRPGEDTAIPTPIPTPVSSTPAPATPSPASTPAPASSTPASSTPASSTPAPATPAPATPAPATPAPSSPSPTPPSPGYYRL